MLNSMSPMTDPADELGALRAAAVRGRKLVDESREIVVVLGEDGRVIAASRRAREALEGLQEGEPLPEGALQPESGRVASTARYEVDGREETLVYLTGPGELAAYEELRAGFTAAVSHELRTPLARILALLETLELPDADPPELIAQARTEVEQIRELIDDVLFLAELETGREVVTLGSTPALPILREVADENADRAMRAGIRVRIEGDESVELPIRPRMIRVVVGNLVQNSLRYAGPGAALTLSVWREGDEVVLEASDDGVGVATADLARLFERFYRADQARASRGTGLGLAIVKHVITSARGSVEAEGAPGRGLTIRCRLPA
jgi:signal transduction histidine kinase